MEGMMSRFGWAALAALLAALMLHYWMEGGR